MRQARGRPQTPLSITRKEERALDRLAPDQLDRSRVAVRARIILRIAAGATTEETAAFERVSVATVWRWKARFLADRVPGLTTRSPVFPERQLPLETAQTALQMLAVGVLSTRAIARTVGISQTTVMRLKRRSTAPNPG